MTRVRAGAVVFGGLALLAVAANIAAQVAMHRRFSDTEFGSLVLDAAVGCVYAICAVVVRRWTRWPAVLLLVGAFVWTAGTFSIAFESAPIWVPLYAVQGGLDVVVVHLALTYPDGRLKGRLPTLAVAAAFTLWIVLLLVRLLVQDPGTWGQCDCAPNPFAALASQQLSTALDPVGPIGNAVLAVLAILAAGARWRVAGTTWRAVNLLMTLSIVALGIAWLAFDVQYVWDLGIDGPGPYYLRAAAMASVAILFAVAVSTMRATRARVADLLLATRDDTGPRAWQHLIRNALGDPSARLALWDITDGRYRYPDGSGEVQPEPGPGVLLITSSAVPVALVRHDPVLDANTELLESMAQAVRLAVENRRLADELAVSLERVRESRARIVDAADDARRRIERDLHDGAQQLLVSTSLTIARASERAGGVEDEALTAELQHASAQLSTARAELRRLAQGITPLVLQHGGIEAAIGELALRSTVEARVTVTGEQRSLAPAAQSTVYFVVAECLANVAKHADAGHVSVRLDRRVPATITVSDDGRGGAAVGAGSGLRGLVDRVEALGGRLTVRSPPGEGTTVIAEVEPKSVERS